MPSLYAQNYWTRWNSHGFWVSDSGRNINLTLSQQSDRLMVQVSPGQFGHYDTGYFILFGHSETKFRTFWQSPLYVKYCFAHCYTWTFWDSSFLFTEIPTQIHAGNLFHFRYLVFGALDIFRGGPDSVLLWERFMQKTKFQKMQTANTSGG